MRRQHNFRFDISSFEDPNPWMKIFKAIEDSSPNVLFGNVVSQLHIEKEEELSRKMRGHVCFMRKKFKKIEAS